MHFLKCSYLMGRKKKEKMPKKKNSNEKKNRLLLNQSRQKESWRERETQISNISQRISIFKVKDLLLG